MLINSYCSNISDYSKRLAYFVPLEDISVCEFKCKIYGHKLDQILFSTQIGFAAHRNHFIFHLMQNVTQRLIPAGIPQHLKKMYTWSLFKVHTEKSDKDPSVLTLEDLEIGFILWMYSCAVTWIAFVLEILASIILNQMKVFILKTLKKVLDDLSLILKC